MVAWRSSLARNVQNIPLQREKLTIELEKLQQMEGRRGNRQHEHQIAKLKNRLQALEVGPHRRR